jgi:hypothetical protein
MQCRIGVSRISVVGGRFSATAIIGPARRLLLAQRFLKDQKQGVRDTAFLPPRKPFKTRWNQAYHHTGHQLYWQVELPPDGHNLVSDSCQIEFGSPCYRAPLSKLLYAAAPTQRKGKERKGLGSRPPCAGLCGVPASRNGPTKGEN